MPVSKWKCRSGLTLIELILIVVVFGILAAVVIPRISDSSAKSKEISAKDALSILRTGISVWFANQAIETGKPSWPSLEELMTPGMVLKQSIPANSFQPPDMASDSIIDGSLLGRSKTGKGRGGWIYNSNTGEIWPNSSQAGENYW